MSLPDTKRDDTTTASDRTTVNLPTPAITTTATTSPVSYGYGWSVTQTTNVSLTADDMWLVHHYLTRTCSVIAYRPVSQIIWRDAIFEHSLSDKALFHGILATSALHAASSHPPNSEAYAKYIRATLGHQDAALASFIAALDNLTQTNCVALFCLSALLCIWSFASNRLPVHAQQSLETSTNIEDVDFAKAKRSVAKFTEIVGYLHGIQAVFIQANQWLKKSEIRELVR